MPIKIMTPEESKESDSNIAQYPQEARRRTSETNVLDLRRQEHQEQSNSFQQEADPEPRSCSAVTSRRTKCQCMLSDKSFSKDSRLTEKAKEFTPEPMQTLELEIFKPLDFYELLFNRMKAK